ncbi:MAG: glycerol-3-phosphate 1-O-acyltransferase PlsY [Firmicutes bacterium]|nr:glycerol-3-phosphate 1-O-acyltransferase PlsY [Bacillota bacterium]
MGDTLFAVLAVIIAYALGNINPAILIGRLHGVDIKKEGSGNAGTTNVLRVLGKKAAAETLLVDIGKGVVAVLIGKLIGGMIMTDPGLLGAWCALAVFCGHIWPAAFGFKGGKGIATGFGSIVTACPPVGGIILLVAIVGMILTQRVSVGSVAAALTLIVAGFYFAPSYGIYFAIMGLIAIWKHRANIGRLIRGEEPKISFKKK